MDRKYWEVMLYLEYRDIGFVGIPVITYNRLALYLVKQYHQTERKKDDLTISSKLMRLLRNSTYFRTNILYVLELQTVKLERFEWSAWYTISIWCLLKLSVHLEDQNRA